MKKVTLVAAVVLAGACAGFYLHSMRLPHGARAAQLVPAETIFFAQFPDLNQTRQRWKTTALAELLAEPEVQAFLEKPRAKSEMLGAWEAKLAQIERIGPREVFFAVTSLEGPVPQFVAGFSFSGSRTHVESVLAEPKAALKTGHPAGKSDLVTYGAAEIEVFSDKETTVVGTFREDWFLVANSLELLQKTLDRFDLQGGSKTLEQAELFTKATAPVSGDRDFLLFTQLGAVKERLGSLIAASGKTIDDQQLLALKNIQAITAVTQLKGPEIRDTIFVFSPGSVHGSVLPRHSLALTSASTLLYYSMMLPASLSLPDSSLALASLALPNLDLLQKTLADQRLSVGDLGQAFGPEIGLFADWPANALQPSMVLALDVRDSAKARAFAKALTSGGLGMAWKKKEHEGTPIFSAPAQGLALTTPTLALHPDFLLLGLSEEALLPALERLKSNGANLRTTPLFEASSLSLTPATGSYGFIDLRGIFERAYGTFRPFLVMSLAFAPEAGQYIDAGKLPSSAAIARHLSPMVLSQSTSEQGMLLESSGTFTFNQALFGLIAGSISAALPDLKNRSTSAAFDPTQLLQRPKMPASPGSSGKPGTPSLDAEPSPESVPAAPRLPYN